VQRLVLNLLTLLFGSLLFILGARLLLLSRRTRQLPELLVGLFFVLLAPAGGLRLIADRTPSDHARTLAAIGTLGVSVAVALVCIFTYRTFRHGVRWAQALMLVGVAALAVGSFVEVKGAALSCDPEPHLSFLTSLFTCLGWSTYEAMRCHLMMRRRLRFRLVEPVVANRFLLYALWTGALALLPAARAIFRIVELTRGEVPWQLPMSFLSLVIAGIMFAAMFLNFWPPEAYLRGLRRGHESEES
jgi:hypothetical protein